MAMKYFILTGIVCAFILGGVAGDLPYFDGDVVYAQESWKAEFDEVCSRTQEATELDADTLKDLIQRCDALKVAIEKLTGAEKKVYLRRLKMCRDLYAFVLESKEHP